MALCSFFRGFCYPMAHYDPSFNEISEFDLQALVDGELDEERRRNLMKKIMQSPDDIERLENLIRQKEQLMGWSKLFMKDH